MGIREESGITGASILGKVSLLRFGVAGLALQLINPVPAHLGTRSNVLRLLAEGVGSSWLLQAVALIVASIGVFRSGVVRGVARCGLIDLAIATVATIALTHIPDRGMGRVTIWGYPTMLVIQLLIGLLFVTHGHTTALKHRIQVVYP